MSVFAVVFGLLVGGIVWEVLDNVQQDRLGEIFRQELKGELHRRAEEAFADFDHQVSSYTDVARLLANHRQLAHYLEPLFWHAEDGRPILEHHEIRPPWLPPAERWSPPIPPSHVALIDASGRLREVYQTAETPFPHGLWVDPSPYVMQRLERGVFSVVDGQPLLLVSETIEDQYNGRIGALLLVVPVDAMLVSAAEDQAESRIVTAVLDGDTQTVLASSAHDSVPPQSNVERLFSRYVITFQSFHDYEGTDFNLQFATLVPRNYLKTVTGRVAKHARNQRATAAVVFVLVYSLLFMLVSNRLSKALKRLAAFSQSALGFTQPPRSGGNQLMVLEDWMRDYIRRVRDAREEMRARHETEMKASTALTAAIMEASLDSIITIDQTGSIIEFNPTAEKVFGFRREQAVSDDITTLIIEESCQDHFWRLLAACLQSSEDDVVDARSELTAVRSDGSGVPVELTIKPIRLEGETLFTVYLRDISARKRQEEEIRSLAAFPSESPSPVLRVNRLGVVSYANEASEPLMKYWGCRRAQTLPLNWRMRIQGVIESAQPQEVEIKTENDRYFSLLLAPIPELDYVNIYAREVTDARVAEAQARQRQTELVHVCRLSSMGEMATGIAHELNQPLSAIVNYANGSRRRLEAGKLSPEAVSEPLRQITLQASRAGEIIRRLRALVSRQPVQRESVYVNSLVEEVLSFVDYEIRKCKVKVETDLGAGVPRVRIDLVQIEQVILNLIRNAIDAVLDNPEDDRIIQVLTRRAPNGQVLIQVEDNGPGMTPDAQRRLFEPFFSTKSTGMGMGLAISQTIAQDHGGNISAVNRHAGGAVFRLELPPASLLMQDKAAAI